MQCSNCEHVFLNITAGSNHVSEVFNDQYFFGGGAGYPDYRQMESLLINRGNFYSKIVKKYKNTGLMLDVGCGAGFLMKGFENEGWHVRGIEPNLTMSEHGRVKYGFDISTTSFESYQDREKYDLITMIQVIAHFFDLRACIDNVRKLLKPDGILLIETWNRESFTAKIMGKSWHEYSPPSVVNWFTPSTLSLLLEEYQLKYVTHKITCKKIQIRHAKSLLESKSKESKMVNFFSFVLKVLPDEATLIYPADDLFYIIFKNTNNL